jgi:hypothetical protein
MDQELIVGKAVMGSLSTVFSAEVMAILRSCAELAFGQEYDNEESMNLL